MIYFANPCSPTVIELMSQQVIGFIDTPRQGNKRPPGSIWCADNGCFGTGYPGDEAWLAWLGVRSVNVADCKFATAPDVVGDPVATLERSLPHLPTIRSIGYPAALVAQDGLENLAVPWNEFDALFIGGSTEWKLGSGAAELVKEANSRGKWTHLGRVNSGKRFSYARSLNCDSVDGTFLTFAPDQNLKRLLGWFTMPEQLTIC